MGTELEFFTLELAFKTALFVSAALLLCVTLYAILVKCGVWKQDEEINDQVLSNQIRKDLDKGKKQLGFSDLFRETLRKL